MSEDTTETSDLSPEVVAAAGATGTTPEAPTNIVAMPAPEVAETASTEAPETPKKPEPKNIQELIASIDLTNVSVDEIVTDLIAGIQQLAVRGTIALGLLERMHQAANADTTPETTPAD